jgi:diguanylate cyclase (GGDEF)-like protein
MSTTTLDPIAPPASPGGDVARQRSRSIAPPAPATGGRGHGFVLPAAGPRIVIQALAGVAMVVLALHTLTNFGGAGFDSFAQDWLYNGIILASAGLCLARAARVQAERAAWLVLGLALLGWAAAELDYSFFAARQSSAQPGVRDALYLAFYPASYAAVVLLLRSRVSRLRPALWLDGLITALAAGAIAAALLVEPLVHASGGYASMAATDIAYVLGDLILMVFVLAVFGLTGWRPGRGWLLIGAGFLLSAVADTVFLYQSANGTYAEGGWVDLLWPMAMLLLGCSAWQRGDRLGSIVLRGWRVLLIPAVCSVVALGLLVYGNLHQLGAVAITLATATLLISVARMATLFSENLRLAAVNSLQAMTDPLTGLGNRRQLLDDLRDAIHAGTPERPWTLLIFDLDSFKAYNDSFGHPAGDALLMRLGRRLATAVESQGDAYRLGGDEFCALLRPGPKEHRELCEVAVDSFRDGREHVQISASHGSVGLPVEALDVSAALQVADRRLYALKRQRRRAAALEADSATL